MSSNLTHPAKHQGDVVESGLLHFPAKEEVSERRPVGSNPTITARIHVDVAERQGLPLQTECVMGSIPSVDSKFHGHVAQLGERCFRTAEVEGSNPFLSTRMYRRRRGNGPCADYDSGHSFHAAVAKLVDAQA